MPFGLHLRSKPTLDWARDLTDSSTAHIPRVVGDINPASNFPHSHVRNEQIGVGSEGKVEQWTWASPDPRWIHHSFVVAVKMIKNRGKKLPAEAEILKNLPLHDKIVLCYGFVQKQPQPDTDSIILQYYPLGDLWSYKEQLWREDQAVASEGLMWSILSQLASAVAFLHEGVGVADPKAADFWRPVVHRDIKRRSRLHRERASWRPSVPLPYSRTPANMCHLIAVQNIFVADIGKKDNWSDFKVKLGDFGLSAYYDAKNKKMAENTGTTILWPPEQTWEGREATPAGDVWAVGCVIHELAHGFPPVEDPNITESAWRKEKGVPQFPRNWTEDVKKSFWAAKSPRKAIPINLVSFKQADDARRKRPTPKFSDVLNECMMLALRMNLEERATAGVLKRMVEEEHKAFLFDDLRQYSTAMQTERSGW
ncbi:kinase-like protein [Trematosphaeria pertusa]|uniref:non-specific serine/threonine protein kinase n=1 Tax=Trematosphaeria pertusa TaxID=390896 RepID=A0A6A6INN4_9PLEO|nr:kinase-like protein [Trematosphaeria pertusa]KAF2251442.1 kinase-like protein [Trematosphaeria pertusa]